jgi:catalase
MSESKKLTNNVGAPVADNQNVMTAGPRGPMLLQDVWFLEKLAHFIGTEQEPRKLFR